MFGVRASYNEQEYTTDFRSEEFSPGQKARAAKLAREIEGKRTGNRHSAEERNQRGRTRGTGPEPDEEELYSGVARTEGPGKGSYVPPHRRETSAPSHEQRSKTNDGARQAGGSLLYPALRLALTARSPPAEASKAIMNMLGQAEGAAAPEVKRGQSVGEVEAKMKPGGGAPDVRVWVGVGG